MTKMMTALTTRIGRTLLTGSVFAAALALAGGLQAQESTAPAAKTAPQSVTTTTAYGGWEVVCSKTSQQKTRECAATYRVVNQQTKANLLVWVFGRNDKDQPLTEIYTFPEVLIAPGVAFTLNDTKSVVAPFISCAGTSCKAAMAMDAAKIKLFKQAKAAKVAVTQNDGKVLTFNLDVSGIDAALKDLEF